MADSNKPVSVSMRIEGSTGTVFVGNIISRGHDVQTQSSGGAHRCDGTNGNEHLFPVPTLTAALDDAARLHRHTITFDATFDAGLDDFLINQIGNDTGTAEMYWDLLLNSSPIQVGGGQQQIKDGDSLLFAFTGVRTAAQPPTVVLKLKGPPRVQINTPVTVYVLNAATRQGVDAATVEAVAGGIETELTNAQGAATFIFAGPGRRTLKASKTFVHGDPAVDLTEIPSEVLQIVVGQ